MEVIAILMVVIGSFSYSMQEVLSRVMKDLHHAVIMLFGGLVGIAGSSIFILIEGAITKEFRIFNYTSKQYSFMLMASSLATLAVNCSIIAF